MKNPIADFLTRFGRAWLLFGWMFWTTAIILETITRAITLKAVEPILPINNYILHNFVLGFSIAFLPAILSAICEMLDKKRAILKQRR